MPHKTDLRWETPRALNRPGWTGQWWMIQRSLERNSRWYSPSPRRGWIMKSSFAHHPVYSNIVV
jgi:hypothetical protein